MFGWFTKKDTTPKVPNYWVGTYDLGWHDGDPSETTGITVINLFEDANGNRSCTVSGKYSHETWYKGHKQYGRVIVPFLNNCPLDFISTKLSAYNVDFWRERGYDVYAQVNSPNAYYKTKREEKEEPTANNEGNVITFPKEQK